MSNFQVFDKSYIHRLIDPFVPGMADHITPISYRAYTPDMFLFLFRTRGNDGQDYYFVAFEFDHYNGEEDIRQIINSFIGVDPIHAVATAETVGTDDIQFEAEVDNTYKCMLLQVPQPTNMGYWSENIVVHKGDNLEEKLKDFTEKERAHVAKLFILATDSREVSVYRRGDHMELFYSA